MERLDGRVAVVTGGASGIGLGLAHRFLAEGMKVVVADIRQDDLALAVEQLSREGDVAGIWTDVADPASVQALADAAMDRFGAVHLLCNNAGIGGWQRFGNTSLDTWEWTMGVNLWGPILGCKTFLPILEAQDEAHIVNTASMSGFIYAPYNAPYNVTKAGVVALTEGLFREFAKEKPHIGVSVLCPAFTKTRIADDERTAPPGHVSRSETDPDMEGMRAELRANLEAGKTPGEIADHVVRGVRERALHIFPHPEWMKVIGDRTDNIMAGRGIDARFTGGLLAEEEKAG